jgi:hypothetical protein
MLRKIAEEIERDDHRLALREIAANYESMAVFLERAERTPPA